MRNINCRNTRREIEEATPGDFLSVAVNHHLTTCVPCETFWREQTKLQELVASLGTVVVPGDFDFRLRARLAREKHATARPFALGSLSLGLRSAAVAGILVVVGTALVFVSLRTRPDNAVPAAVAKTVPTEKATSPIGAKDVSKGGGPEIVEGLGIQPIAAETEVKPAGQLPAKRRELRPTQLASFKGNSHLGTRDLSSTTAPVLRPDQLAEAYPSSAFPIDASYQSLKVSVDDGRGSSRTISLPTVSFGSQRALSQSASPLMASARGVW